MKAYQGSPVTCENAKKWPLTWADRLGHTSVRTVLDVYGHLYEGADEAAAERLDEQIVFRSQAVGKSDQVSELGT